MRPSGSWRSLESPAGGRKHAPVPHHHADGGAALAVGARIRQFVGVAKGFAGLARSHASRYVELMLRQVVPQRAQSLPVFLVAGLKVVIRGAAAGIHGANRVSFKLGARGEGNAA